MFALTVHLNITSKLQHRKEWSKKSLAKKETKKQNKKNKINKKSLAKFEVQEAQGM